jgi:hypothetical protein
MPFTYQNRRGHIYYFKQGLTKTGKPKYYATKDSTGELLEELPDQFEIYESPSDAAVVLRKKVFSLFADEEVGLVKDAIEKLSDASVYIIDLKERYLTIYLGCTDKKELAEYMRSFGSFSRAKINEILAQQQYFSPEMRFAKENNNYVVERWCHLGSIDKWIFITHSTDLSKLAKKYCYHLGRESFYELI